MTTFEIFDCNNDFCSLSGPANTADMFDELVSQILPHGRSGQTLWFGPTEHEDSSDGSDYERRRRGRRREELSYPTYDLRIDIDIDLNRAALTWLADGTIAIELAPGPVLDVMSSIDEPCITVPGTIARVSAVTARSAVIEYVTTGKRPTCVEWTSKPSATIDSFPH